MLAALVTTIMINIARVVGIMILAQDQGLASSVYADHVLYGWQLYSVVIILLAAAGAWWSDRDRFASNGASFSVFAGSAWPRVTVMLVASLAALLVFRFVPGAIA